MNGVEKAGGAELADAIRELSQTFPRRWLERGLPPSLRRGHGVEERTGWIRANIAEDRARGIRGPINGPTEMRRRLEFQRQRIALMRKKYPPL